MPEGIITVEKYFFWLVTYSIIGWIYECIVESIRQKKIVNRGFLNGPYCPIYGFGALLDVLVLGWLSDYPVILFLSSAVLTCTLEYITSIIMENLFNQRWWDYYDFKFNIDGRVCLWGALAFGTLSILLVKFIHPFMVDVTERFTYPMFHVICTGLLLLLIIDSFFTIMKYSDSDDKLKYIFESMDRIRSGFRDNAENTQRNSSMHEKFNEVYKNFIKSLPRPHFRFIKYSKISAGVKKLIFRRKK